MNKKFTKLIILLFLVITLTGCTVQLKNDKNAIVINKETGQSLTKNILCQPTNTTIITTYATNKVDITKLPKCVDMPVVTGKYEDIWTSIFVKPLAWLIIKIGEFTGSYGFSIIVTTIIIRLLMIPATKKSILQSENMKKAKPDLARLEAKYIDKKDKDATMQKSQEMMLIYKKHQISPAAGCLYSLLQIPLFFAYYEAIARIPVIFEETFIGFQLGTNPMTALGRGHYQYLIFIVLIVAATYYSFKLNGTTSMSADQEKQMQTMMKFMIAFIFIASLTLPTGLAVYWVTNSIFTIAQNMIVKRSIKI